MMILYAFQFDLTNQPKLVIPIGNDDLFYNMNYGMNIKLDTKNTLIFFDIESTGTDTRKNRIIELSSIKITLDGKREIITKRFNPGIPIAEGATSVHGIKDEDLINEPKFAEKAQEIHDYFLGCDLAGYNIFTFDIRMLTEEFLQAGLMPLFNNETKIIDGMRIFNKMQPSDLAAAYKFYCNKEMTNTHQAEADTLAALDVLDKDFELHTIYIAKLILEGELK
ncbi:MAG: hypothetical protein RLZZ361_737 [Cyanobacteriota bacterium]|jgi:DNA polymerase-3 subunit epsilon